MDPQTAPPFDCNLHAPPRPEMGSEQHRLALSKLPGSQSAMLCDDSMCRPTRGIAYCRKISHPTADIVWFSKGEIGIMICMAKSKYDPTGADVVPHVKTLELCAVLLTHER